IDPGVVLSHIFRRQFPAGDWDSRDFPACGRPTGREYVLHPYRRPGSNGVADRSPKQWYLWSERITDHREVRRPKLTGNALSFEMPAPAPSVLSATQTEVRRGFGDGILRVARKPLRNAVMSVATS